MPRFVDPIKVGLWILIENPGPLIASKRQTIRAERADGRHARPGDLLQLYCRQRHPSGFLIGKARCIDATRIEIGFRRKRRSDWVRNAMDGLLDRPDGLDEFARRDGFQDWAELREFWSVAHPGVDDFKGVMIRWEPP